MLTEDPRILGAWLWGSFSRGSGDAYSDLDFYVVVGDDDHSTIVDRWEELIDRISATLSKCVRPFGNTPILSAITPEWQRFDLILVPLAEIGRPRHRPWLLLFDRADVDRRLGPVSPAPLVSPNGLLPLVENFFWVLGMLTVPLGRQDFLLGIEGAMLLRRTLVDLMLIENGSDEASTFWRNQSLSPEQRRSLESLPPLAATRESVIAHHVACWRVFQPLARRVLEQKRLAYPDQLEKATLAQLRQIGMDVV